MKIEFASTGKLIDELHVDTPWNGEETFQRKVETTKKPSLYNLESIHNFALQTKYRQNRLIILRAAMSGDPQRRPITSTTGGAWKARRTRAECNYSPLLAYQGVVSGCSRSFSA